MDSIDARPAPLPDGHREGLRSEPGRGWGPPPRDDLIHAPLAQALGYAVAHRNGDATNAANFDGAGVAIWYAADGWQARDLRDGRHSGPRRVYGDRGASLATAPLREAPSRIAAPAGRVTRTDEVG